MEDSDPPELPPGVIEPTELRQKREQRTEDIRDKLRQLYNRREQRKIQEALRQVDGLMSPAQREEYGRSAKQLAEFTNTPAIRDALRTINSPEIRKAVEQIQEAQAAREAVEGYFIREAIKWLEAKWGDHPCPYCGATEWQVGTPLEISLGGEEAMSPAFPVMCGNCGQTTLVNAIVAGILPDPDEEVEA